MLHLENPLCRGLMEVVEGKGLPRVKIRASLDQFEIKEGVLYHV